MVETIVGQGVQPMLRTRNVQPSLWESVLPEVCLRLPVDKDPAAVRAISDVLADCGLQIVRLAPAG
jgi:hypothetical protein